MTENEILGWIIFSLFLLFSIASLFIAEVCNSTRFKNNYIKLSLSTCNVVIILALFISSFLSGYSIVLYMCTVLVFLINLVDLVYTKPKEKVRISNMQSYLCYKCKLSELFVIESTKDNVRCIDANNILSLVHKSFDFHDLYFTNQKVIFRNTKQISNSRIYYILKAVNISKNIKKELELLVKNKEVCIVTDVIEYFKNLEIEYPAEQVKDSDINFFLHGYTPSRFFTFVFKKINKIKHDDLI